MPTIELITWRLGEEPSQTQQDRQYLRILRADPCSYCGHRTGAGVTDHIVPRAMRGPDDWTNRTAACRNCNANKGSRSLLAALSGQKIGDDHRARERRRLEAFYAGQAL